MSTNNVWPRVQNAKNRRTSPSASGESRGEVTKLSVASKGVGAPRMSYTRPFISASSRTYKTFDQILGISSQFLLKCYSQADEDDGGGEDSRAAFDGL